MIHEIAIAGYSGYDQVDATEMFTPPARLLVIDVSKGKAALDIYENPGGTRAAKPTASVEVPAESLRIALNALIEASSVDE